MTANSLGEIGVRLALGARQHQIVGLLIRQELLLPVVVVVAWWFLYGIVDAIFGSVMARSPLSNSGGLAAALVVSVTLCLGSIFGFLGPLRRPPMDALRAE